MVLFVVFFLFFVTAYTHPYIYFIVVVVGLSWALLHSEMNAQMCACRSSTFGSDMDDDSCVPVVVVVVVVVLFFLSSQNVLHFC